MDIAYLGVTAHFNYDDIMSMPSSRRHRLVKSYQERDRKEEAAAKLANKSRRS